MERKRVLINGNLILMLPILTQRHEDAQRHNFFYVIKYYLLADRTYALWRAFATLRKKIDKQLQAEVSASTINS